MAQFRVRNNIVIVRIRVMIISDKPTEIYPQSQQTVPLKSTTGSPRTRPSLLWTLWSCEQHLLFLAPHESVKPPASTARKPVRFETSSTHKYIYSLCQPTAVRRRATHSEVLQPVQHSFTATISAHEVVAQCCSFTILNMANLTFDLISHI